jgi:MerR family redox-sensitive transcriptional activator SoxR
MATLKTTLSIGDMAARTGLSVSAIRFYEDKGLVTPERNAGGQRRYTRADLRRLSFIMAAQRLGLSLTDIAAALESLPADRAPSKADWAKVATGIEARLDAQIAMLQALREKLGGCIGCGCLSLETCTLYNPDDRAGAVGPGPRFIFQDDGLGR